MKYRLEKIAIEKHSSVCLGSITKGLLLVKNNDNISETMEDIQEGSMIMVGFNMIDFIKTSPIIEVLQKSDELMVFKTQTSTYLLEKINE
jgi:hypothetical protein